MRFGNPFSNLLGDPFGSRLRIPVLRQACKRPPLIRLLGLLTVLPFGLLLSSAPAVAQPEGLSDRPIRIVVPFTAGGNVDIVARLIAQGLSEQLKVNVIVENKAGANAIIGAEAVANAAADGHTLLLGTAETHAINPHIYRKLAYDPLKQFTTVGIVSSFPFALVVSPKLPVTSLKEFIEHARQHRGGLNYATWGIGSTSQIAFEQLKQSSGIDLVHVPFKGAAPAITAVSAGEVEAFMVPLSVALPQASTGRVRLLAITSAERDDTAPEVPTASESGVPVVISGWHILAAPAATPPAVVKQLNAALNAVTDSSDFSARLLKQGVRPATSSPEAAQAMVAEEWQRWGTIARKAGISAD
jgi:tripartite-type tricarboxylate transporter receptor subunit TctC